MECKMIDDELNKASPALTTNLLKGVNKLQNSRKGLVLSIVQLSILHELYYAWTLKEQGKRKHAQVPISHIKDVYDIEMYTVSRNVMMLSEGSIKDRGEKREGKGWLTVAALKQPEGEVDERKRGATLNAKGLKFAKIIFENGGKRCL